MDEASKMVNVSALFPSLFLFSRLSAEWQEATSGVETKSGCALGRRFAWKSKKTTAFLFDLAQHEDAACKMTGLQGF